MYISMSKKRCKIIVFCTSKKKDTDDIFLSYEITAISTEKTLYILNHSWVKLTIDHLTKSI